MNPSVLNQAGTEITGDTGATADVLKAMKGAHLIVTTVRSTVNSATDESLA